MPITLLSNLLGILGAVVGGAVGLFLFGWFCDHGFYPPFVPGVLIGLGCSALARHRSMWRGIACGIGATGVGLFGVWWKLSPRLADPGFDHFLVNLHQLRAIYLLFIGLGGLIAFWLGRDYFGTGLVPSSSKPGS